MKILISRLLAVFLLFFSIQASVAQYITRAPRSEEVFGGGNYTLYVPGVLPSSVPYLSVAHDLTVSETLTVQDLDITGTIIFPPTVEFTGGVALVDDSTQKACLRYVQPDGFEKGRICSKQGIDQKGIVASLDGGTTAHLAIESGGTVAVAQDLTVGQTGYAQDLFVSDTARVLGDTRLQTTFLQGMTNVQSGVFFSQGVPALAQNTIQVTKGTITGPNQFNSIRSAVDSITTASSANPFEVQVGPGVYIEDTIIMKPHVSIIGAGDDIPVIMPTNPNNAIIVGAPNTRLSGCSFIGATGAGAAAIEYSGGGVFEIFDCVFGDNDTFLRLNNSTTPQTFIRLDRVFVRGNAQFRYGIYADGSGVFPLCGEMKGITWLSEGNPLLESFFFLSGGSFQAVLSDICTGNPAGTAGTGITLQDGAILRLKNSQVFWLSRPGHFDSQCWSRTNHKYDGRLCYW